MPDVQGGLMAIDRPMGGLISTREERITHFQQFVQAATDAATADSTTADSTTAGGNLAGRVDVSWNHEARATQALQLPR